MLPSFLLIPLVALYRIVMAWQTTGLQAVNAHDPFTSWLPGFCPLAAVALCAGAFLPRRLAFVAPLSILLLSDVVINAHYGAALLTVSMVSRYVLLALVCGLGLALGRSGRRPGLGQTLAATVAASTFFYVASNTLSWLGAPEYAQTFGGWFQALTTGLPGYLPSWYFYRNALVSDGLFSMVFVVCLARDAARPVDASAPALDSAVGR